jgi:hypothetical protein
VVIALSSPSLMTSSAARTPALLTLRSRYRRSARQISWRKSRSSVATSVGPSPWAKRPGHARRPRRAPPGYPGAALRAGLRRGSAAGPPARRTAAGCGPRRPHRARAVEGLFGGPGEPLVQDLLPVLRQHARRRRQIGAAGECPGGRVQAGRLGRRCVGAPGPPEVHRWPCPSPVASGAARMGAPHGWASRRVIWSSGSGQADPSRALLRVDDGLSRAALMAPVGEQVRPRGHAPHTPGSRPGRTAWSGRCAPRTAADVRPPDPT